MSTKEQLLEYFKNVDTYISGENLSELFHVSRTAIWKNVNALRKQGYQIESVTNRGYRLVSSPDILTEENISQGLKTTRLAKKIYYFDIIDSTNEEAKRQAQKMAPDGSLFIAEQQSGGKGRLGRSWTSSPGTGLWFSLILRNGFTPDTVSNITLLAGLSVCRAIRSSIGCNAKIKWPNDIVIGSRKVCGILTEMTAEMEQIEYVIPGIGINVNIASFPEELKNKATSLKIETGTLIPRIPLLQQILLEFENLLNRFECEEIPSILEDYRPLCVSLNRKVSFTRKGVMLSGVATDISPTGELVVQCDNGEIYNINSGEVTVQGIYGQ